MSCASIAGHFISQMLKYTYIEETTCHQLLRLPASQGIGVPSPQRVPLCVGPLVLQIITNAETSTILLSHTHTHTRDKNKDSLAIEQLFQTSD